MHWFLWYFPWVRRSYHVVVYGFPVGLHGIFQGQYDISQKYGMAFPMLCLVVYIYIVFPMVSMLCVVASMAFLFIYMLFPMLLCASSMVFAMFSFFNVLCYALWFAIALAYMVHSFRPPAMSYTFYGMSDGLPKNIICFCDTSYGLYHKSLVSMQVLVACMPFTMVFMAFP